MSPEPLSPETRSLLAEISTATLTSQLMARGLRNTFMQKVYRLTTGGPSMVGEAFTLRYIPAREDIDVSAVFEDRNHPQRKAVETIPSGHVLVIDCRQDIRAAGAGSILVTRTMMKGAAGVVTDGGLRDSPTIEALDYPVYCGGRSAPTNLTRHHAVDINVPIGCGDVPVYPGDIIVGDREGVVVIPRHLADEVAKQGKEQTLMEDFVTERVLAGQSTFGLYPPNAETLAQFEAWKKQR
ncbi:ribonuclease activity regulator RraA [Taklimakanibacter albus]|uniref:Ribonuclease activity regulator RraA n=1 Tax=Taklimakanibacter albus TaxID=2800327 RepID=A0ACC5R737_9HYPH|nr:ribonuclease activity regulator RraA [Aestuariivirga sp. YIM B02566]MBK1868481.1 ribonuclease activity regulator RraA [Aestuariivirga sp. YIM B02566]